PALPCCWIALVADACAKAEVAPVAVALAISDRCPSLVAWALTNVPFASWLIPPKTYADALAMPDAATAAALAFRAIVPLLIIVAKAEAPETSWLMAGFVTLASAKAPSAKVVAPTTP